MHKLNLLFCFMVLCCLPSCTDHPVNDKNLQISESKTDETESVKQVAASFYNWYLSVLNVEKITVAFEGEVVKDTNGNCKLDLEPYFLELRKLKTISEKFIEKERGRLRECADYMSTIPYSDYEAADAYTYDKHCGSFYYHYWLNSQELYETCRAGNISIHEHNTAEAEIFFTYKGETEDKIPLSKVYLEKENGLWKLTDIVFHKN